MRITVWCFIATPICVAAQLLYKTSTLIINLLSSYCQTAPLSSLYRSLQYDNEHLGWWLCTSMKQNSSKFIRSPNKSFSPAIDHTYRWPYLRYHSLLHRSDDEVFLPWAVHDSLDTILDWPRDWNHSHYPYLRSRYYQAATGIAMWAVKSILKLLAHNERELFGIKVRRDDAVNAGWCAMIAHNSVRSLFKICKRRL